MSAYPCGSWYSVPLSEMGRDACALPSKLSIPGMKVMKLFLHFCKTWYSDPKAITGLHACAVSENFKHYVFRLYFIKINTQFDSPQGRLLHMPCSKQQILLPRNSSR